MGLDQDTNITIKLISERFHLKPLTFRSGPWVRTEGLPKKGNAKEGSNYHTTALISQASKVMLKILQAKLQQYMNQELPDVQAGYRKGRGTRNQIANIRWSQKKQENSRKTSTLLHWLCFTDCVDHNKLWKIQEIEIPDHLTCLLRNLFAGQEATVRIGHGTTHWFQIGKGVCQGCILSPSLFNLYAEYNMRNASVDEAQAESRLPGKTSITSKMQMTPALLQKAKRNWRASW